MLLPLDLVKGMTTLAEIDAALQKHEAALPCNQYNFYEKMLVWSSLFLLIGVMAGLILFFDTVWTETLKPIIWDPILKDAGVAGDAGYSPQNTFIYTSSMLICVVVLQALFRRMNLPSDDRMTLALIAWVCLAPILRVLEDADFFSSEIDFLLISPLIHLHLAAWLVAVAVISHFVAGQWDGAKDDETEDKVRSALFAVLAFGLLGFWALLFRPSYAYHDSTGTLYSSIGLGLSLLTVLYLMAKTRGWQAMTRGLLIFASAAIVMGLGYWAQFIATPWAQESGRVSESVVVWPVLIVMVLPALVCYTLYKMGIDDYRHLTMAGFEPGILPDEVTIEAWEEEDEIVANHPVQMLSNKALLATPMTLAMVYGQLLDGFATMVGIDFYGYGEKHPLSDAVIQYGGQINDMLGIEFGEGAWLFALVKALLIGTIVWMFTQTKLEYRYRHLRQLIALAVLIVGLAPGLRDVGRLALGV